MKVNVCIVTFPLGQAGYTPLSNLAKLFSRLANRIYVVSGGAALHNLEPDANVHVIKIIHNVSSKVLMRFINYAHTQLKIMCKVAMISRKTDIFVFFIGGEGLIVPMLALKLLRKTVVAMPGGIALKGYLARNDPLSTFIALLVGANFSLADKLVLYSSRLTKEAGLARYQSKIITAHEHFVDFTAFTMKKKIGDRPNAVGYIGRLSKEKGILNLVLAMRMVLKNRADVRFVLCGEGSLSSRIDNILRAEKLDVFVRLTGWVPHEDVPKYLNQLKLLVLPSLTEGLPNTILEAMASGTPVLATPVGVTANIIKNGETGFFLDSSHPKHIADRIVVLLSKPDLLEKVSVNAYKWVRQNFSEEKTLDSWRRIFQDLITFD